MKFIFAFILISWVTADVMAQTQIDSSVVNDSAYINAQLTIKSIQQQIRQANSASYEKIVDSLSLVYQKSQEIQKRYEHRNWEQQTDSMMQRSKTDVNSMLYVGLLFNGNQLLFSMQNTIVAKRYRKFDIGIGSGIEYLNRGQGLVTLTQAPLFISNRFFVSKMCYAHIDYGFTVPLSGTYKNSNDETVNYKEADLKTNYYLNIGAGILNRKNWSLQISIRNQSLGVPEPLNERKWLIGFNWGFYLW